LARTVADVWYSDPATFVHGSSIGASARDGLDHECTGLPRADNRGDAI